MLGPNRETNLGFDSISIAERNFMMRRPLFLER